MTHTLEISTKEAAILLETLRKIRNANRKSLTVTALFNIDSHDIEKMEIMLNRIEIKNKKSL
jgi:hypothetical protein